MMNKTIKLYKQIMKHNPEAIDKIESLKEAKDIIKMMMGNIYLHEKPYQVIDEGKYMLDITGNPLVVCLDVQHYLAERYDIDFITTRTKIFPLAKQLKGRYKDERLVTRKQLAEDLYKLYINDN